MESLSAAVITRTNPTRKASKIATTSNMKKSSMKTSAALSIRSNQRLVAYSKSHATSDLAPSFTICTWYNSHLKKSTKYGMRNISYGTLTLVKKVFSSSMIFWPSLLSIGYWCLGHRLRPATNRWRLWLSRLRVSWRTHKSSWVWETRCKKDLVLAFSWVRCPRITKLFCLAIQSVLLLKRLLKLSIRISKFSQEFSVGRVRYQTTGCMWRICRTLVDL